MTGKTKRYTVGPLNVSDFNDDTFEGLLFFKNEDRAYNSLDRLEKTSKIDLELYEVELNITFV